MMTKKAELWTEADRPRLVKQGLAYLDACGNSLAEREELADIAISQQVSMREALEIFLSRRS